MFQVNIPLPQISASHLYEIAKNVDFASRKTNLIGICGRAGSGKDTFAQLLQNYIGNAQSYSFAGPLKDACCLLFGWDRTQIDHDRQFKQTVDPKWGFSPRQAMQTLGTEWGRVYLRPDIWIHMADVKYKESKRAFFIVKDVRFQNQTQWIRENNGTLIHIIRPDSEFKIDAGHISQKPVEFQEGDIKIMNDSTLQELSEKARDIANKLWL